MILVGISLFIKPEFFFDWLEGNMENYSLYISAIAVRLVMGVLFLATARKSKYPGVIKFLGYLFILAALIFIFIGQESFHDFISTVIPSVKPYAQGCSLFVIAFGSFFIYAFSKNVKVEEN